jgi:membrane peptidoglycan carboxypeptidase
MELPSGPWRPTNMGRPYRGAVDLREALVSSLNVPFVRAARWCGFSEVAETFRRLGLDVPEPPPPSFVLGSLGTSPAELAGAYTAVATLGVVRRPVPVLSLHRPSGARIAAFDGDAERVAEPAAAFMVRDLMRDVVRRGTGRGADVEGLEAWGKTGSSSEFRDAWFVGGARSVVAALWVGLDAGSPLGLSSLTAAVPIWRDFMVAAAPTRPPLRQRPPDDVAVLWVQDRTGRIVDRPRKDSHSELFDRDHLPAGRRWWRPDPPLPVIE